MTQQTMNAEEVARYTEELIEAARQLTQTSKETIKAIKMLNMVTVMSILVMDDTKPTTWELV